MSYSELLADRLEPGHKIGGKWRVLDFINNGGCANVYLVQDEQDEQKTRYAAKVTSERLSFTLGHEYEIYKALNESEAIPSLPSRAFGYDDGRSYLIMELLGCNLREYRRYFPLKQVPVPTIARFGIQMLNFIETTHRKGYLYVDVKPENFMLTVGTTQQTPSDQLKIHAADFGLSQRFRINGKHRPFKHIKSRIGTLNFMSLNAELKNMPSRRDDVESVVYVLLFLHQGGLPWEYAATDEEGFTLKRDVEMHMPDADTLLFDMLREIRRYAYAQEPDYDGLRRSLQNMGRVRRRFFS